MTQTILDKNILASELSGTSGATPAQIEQYVSILAREDGDDDPSTIDLSYYVGPKGSWKDVTEWLAVTGAGNHAWKRRALIDAATQSGVDQRSYWVAIDATQSIEPIVLATEKILKNHFPIAMEPQQKYFTANVADVRSLLSALRLMQEWMAGILPILQRHRDPLAGEMELRLGNVNCFVNYLQRYFSTPRTAAPLLPDTLRQLGSGIFSQELVENLRKRQYGISMDIVNQYWSQVRSLIAEKMGSLTEVHDISLAVVAEVSEEAEEVSASLPPAGKIAIGVAILLGVSAAILWIRSQK